MVDSTIGNVTTLIYDLTAPSCSYLINNATWTGSTDLQIFPDDVSFYNKELIIDLLDYPGHVDNKYTYFDFISMNDAPNLKIVKIKEQNIYDERVVVSNMNNTNFYIGCFGDGSCQIPTFYKVYMYSNSFTMFFEDIENYVSLKYKTDNAINFNGYPYVFIGSLSSIKLNIIIEILESHYDYEYFSSLSGSFYLLTSSNLNVNFYLYSDPTIENSPQDSMFDDGFVTLNVCSKKDSGRYVMFNDGHTPYTNCSCWTKNNETDMDIDSVFNYPDCNYNSSMFDLILPSSPLTYTLSDDLLEWYSIVFTKPIQSIKINEGKKLIIDELDLNQEDTLFNENVFVKNLTVSTLTSSFNVLNFDNINYYDIDIKENETLITIQSTSTNLEQFGLKVCNKTKIVLITTTPCEEDFINDDSSAKSYLLTFLSILSFILILI